MSNVHEVIIDGKKIAKAILDDLAKRVARLPFKPVFCDVLVGDNPVSRQYVNQKRRTAEDIGMEFLPAEFPETISENVLVEEIQKISSTPHLTGLIVQLPLPQVFNRTRVLDAIELSLDVDCLHSHNLSAFYEHKPTFIPPTPAAVLAVLDSVFETDVTKKIVVVGQGELVGRPVAFMLRERGYAVVTVDRNSKEPERVAKQADVIITAAGSPGLITEAWVKPGSIVIDAGSAEQEGLILGDVDSASVKPIAGFFSPTPGGVGPVTVAKLLENVMGVAESEV